MKKILFVLLSVFVLSACQTTPVYNVEQSNIPTGVLAKQVEKSVIKALIQKGWQVKANANGKILAEIMVRTHTAKIEITFDDKQYSINYVDSTNLKYNAENNTIHKNYNNWIIYIDRLIQMALVDESYQD